RLRTKSTIVSPSSSQRNQSAREHQINCSLSLSFILIIDSVPFSSSGSYAVNPARMEFIYVKV
ncbi:hypothetical protein FRX31_015243, partial [Thalictrum thalictroides]